MSSRQERGGKRQQAQEESRQRREDKEEVIWQFIQSWVFEELTGPALCWALCRPGFERDLFTRIELETLLGELLEAFDSGEA